MKITKRQLVIGAGGLLLIVLIGYLGLYPYTTSFETICTVQTKSIKQLSGEDHQTYLIGTDVGSFKIEDNVSHWQFKSFDLFSDLQENKTYRIKAYGWRSGLFSSFPNIYAVEKIDQ